MEPLRSCEHETDTCADRRASRRVRVTCPATLQTMTTTTVGILGDISETGARFEADEPPGKGATAVLKWGNHEAVCTIIWHDEGACGVWFKQPLPSEVVEETAALDRVVELPIASVGNITQGRKRSMAFLKRAPVEDEIAPVPPRPAVVEDAPAAPLGLPRATEDVPARARMGLPAALEKVFRSAISDERPLPRKTRAEPPGRSDLPEPRESVPEPAFGRAAGLPSPSIGHSESLAEVLRRYRQDGNWER